MAIAIRTVHEQVSEEEWKVRQDLAALYRLVAMHGWDDGIFTHITARVPGPDYHFLINPFGVLFESVTASNLVKIDLEGKIVLETSHPINPAGYIIHSAIHEVREDAKCVIHLHTRAGAAVAAQQQGLLRISQQSSLALASLAYHDYEGIALNPDEKVRLQQDLGDKTAMILRNHGTLVAASSIAAAWLHMYNLETACQIQIAAQSGGAELITLSEDITKLNIANTAEALESQGAQLLWNAMVGKVARRDPSYSE